MNLLSLNSETPRILTKFCNQKSSKYRNLVKICNELVKKWKIWFLRQDPAWSELILARGQPTLEKGQKRAKGQTKILGPPSLIWDQISEIWPQKGQPGNPGCEFRNFFLNSILFQERSHKKNLQWTQHV